MKELKKVMDLDFDFRGTEEFKNDKISEEQRKMVSDIIELITNKYPEFFMESTHLRSSCYQEFCFKKLAEVKK